MDVVGNFVPADGIHIGIQAVADEKFVFFEREPLPLGERMDDLRLFTDCRHVKGYRTLHAVQVVVQAGAFGDKQRRRYPFQMERGREISLEAALDEIDRALGFVYGQLCLVACGNIGVCHRIYLTATE